MRIADLVDFISGTPPDFHRPDAQIRPGDKFGRYQRQSGWTYVEVIALNDGHLPDGCVYARAFSGHHRAGREGYCRLSQLGLRIDHEAWSALRASGWPPLGAVLGFGADEPDPSRPLHS
jgi:hypothetical protein